VFREQAAQNPALLFIILQLRHFMQKQLLGKRPRERRYPEYDSLYATGKAPIAIDLSNLAKTEKEIIRRRKQDEELQREKQKREQRDLEDMRRLGRSGLGGGGGSGSSNGGGGGSSSSSSAANSLKDSASGLTSKKQAPAAASGGNGSILSPSSALGGMASLTMSGAGAALFSR
jgi:hypothetical protein